MANPNSSDMEKAESNRETIEQNIADDYPKGKTGTGITNRKIDEEVRNQERVPDRGAAKGEQENRVLPDEDASLKTNI